MTDLEMTRLCALSMGWYTGKPANKVVAYEVSDSAIIAANDKGGESVYDPLHDDAQAMALVKKFSLDIEYRWTAKGPKPYVRGTVDGWETTGHFDLNRAICEVVAKMQERVAAEQEGK